MALHALGNKVAFASLLYEEGDDIQLRTVKNAAEVVAIEDAIDNVLCVKMFLIDIGYDCDLGPF
jgi:hypothetical protein